MAFEWFRSWHGAPTDSKFLLIAKRAQVAPGMVSAVYWALLDYASQNEPRGSVEGFDTETYSEWAGWEESDVIAVIAALTTKGAIVDGKIVAWEKRQPKREDPTAAERQARYRDAQRNAVVTQDNAVTNEVTQSNAVSRRVTRKNARLDKTRSDKIIPETLAKESNHSSNGAAADALIDPDLTQALSKWRETFTGTPYEANPPIALLPKWLAYYGPDVLCHMIGKAQDKSNPSGWLYTTYDNWRKDGEVAPYIVKEISAAKIAAAPIVTKVMEVIWSDGSTEEREVSTRG